MADSPLQLGYATPPPRRRWEHDLATLLTRPVPDRRWGVSQLGIGVAVMAVALLGVTPRFSDGRWPARVAWIWLDTGVAMLNAVAAVLAARGATRPPQARRGWYAGYVLACLMGLALIPAALTALDRWPAYVSYNPSAPAVNDHRYYPGAKLYRQLPLTLLLVNPMLILIGVRGLLWPLSRVVARRRPASDVPGQPGYTAGDLPVPPEVQA